MARYLQTLPLDQQELVELQKTLKKLSAMRTRIYVTVLAIGLTLGWSLVATEVSAQSSTRRGTTTKEAPASTPKSATSAHSTDRSSATAGVRSTSTPRSTTTGTSGRNYNDHIKNISIGNNDRPNGNINNKNNDNNNRKPNVAPNTNSKPTNDKKIGSGDNRPGSNSNKFGNNNPPRGKDAKGHSMPRYNRNDPNRHLGYTPFKDGRVIHRPHLYDIAFDYGIRFSNRPVGAVRVRFGGLTLYFSSGVWYNYSNGYYTIYRPPVGTVISYNTIANDLYYVDFEVATNYGIVYYVDSYANFYTPVRNFRTYGTSTSLEVVDAPIGAILYDLPSDYKEIRYNGYTYYVVGNSVFEYIYSASNSWYFRCIGLYK